MKVGANARIFMIIGLGFLAGLSAIALPQVMSGFQNASPIGLKTATNSTDGTTSYGPAATGSTTTIGPANATRTNQLPEAIGLTISAFSVLVSVLVIPALTLAFLTSTWAGRRRRTGFKDTSEKAVS